MSKDMFPPAPEQVPMKSGETMAYFDKWDGFIGVLNGKSEVREQPAHRTPKEKYEKFYGYDVLRGKSYQDKENACSAKSDVACYSWCLFHGEGTIASRLTRDKAIFSDDLKRVDITKERKLLVRWIFTWKENEE